MEIFKEYDIRGLYPEEINEEKAYRISRAIATFLKGKRIFLGYDNRVGSLAIKEYVKKGLVESGKEVIDLGLGPIMIPVFASFIEKTNGLCITASHNPAKYTGLLPYNKGVTVTPEKIKSVYDKGKFAEKIGSLTEEDYYERYISYITKGIGRLNLNIGIDSMGGSTTSIAVDIFKRLYCKIKMLHAKPDSNFYGKTPEPIKENAYGLEKMVKANRLDMGVQFDADGDRVAFVDEKGRFVDPMIITMIFIKYLKLKKVVATVACSSHLEEFANVTYSKVGRPNIEKKLANKKFDLGVETASHYYFARYFPFSDGLLGGVLMASILNKTGKRLSQLVDEFPKVYFDSISIPFKNESKRTAKLNEIEKEAVKYGKIEKIDGIKVINEQGFMLFRKSNTEPILRVYYEGRNEEAFKKIKSTVNSIIG
jgi:phosphomannomutase/phosphoglucomutase